MKRFRIALVAVAAAGVAIALVLTATRSGAQIGGSGPLDLVANHYKCYRITEWDHFTPVDHRLSDQFGVDVPADVLRPSLLCNPTKKDDTGIPKPNWHLVCYEILVDQDPIEHKADIKNQYGLNTVKTFEPELLCLPSLKNEV
jgi:hypothetical protein